MLTAQEAAQELRVSRSTIYNLVARREIAYCRVGGSIRIPKEAIEEYVARHMEGARS